MDVYKQDRFFVEDIEHPHEVIWMFHDYDDMGMARFTKIYIDTALVRDALKERGNDAFNFMCEYGKQSLIREDEWCYGDAETLFESEPFANEVTQETLNKIRKMLKI